MKQKNQDKAQDHDDLAKLKRQVNSLMKNKRIEEKYILLRDQSLSVASRTSTNLLLNPIARGTTVQSRIADKVMAKRLVLSGVFGWTQSTAAQNQLTLRIMVIRDTESNGAVPLFNAVNPATGYLFIGAQANLQTYSLPNFNNTEISRYEILHDEQLSLHQGVTSATSNCILTQPWSLKLGLGGKVASYVRGNAGDITDIDKGAVYIYFWNDFGTQLSLIFDSAYYFTDE